MKRAAILAAVCVAAPAAADDTASVNRGLGAASKQDDLDVRLTLSSFLYTQSGNDPAPLVPDGASPQNASPINRFFGDLRAELRDAGFTADMRVRETTSQEYQSGADGGGEYEIRTLDYRIGSRATNVTVGRQFVDAVGETKIDGVTFNHKLGGSLFGTIFAGAFPQLGSRSVDTDYIHAINSDGSTGSLVIPLAAGLGAAYQGADYHFDLGGAGIYVPQDVPGATADQKSRVYVASIGYFRPSPKLDLYHFALLDVAGADGVDLVNGSFGADVRPVPTVQLSLAVHHVSTDILQIVARNYLADPDPTAQGVVQNNIALLKISSDMARAGASVALAEQRFEISASATVRRRPGVSVELADMTGAVVFPEERSIYAQIGILDRRSIGGARVAVTAALTQPLGGSEPNRSRGEVVRAVASWWFSKQRGQIEADVAGEHFQDVGAPSNCTSSVTIPLSCYGTSSISAGQAGALVSWRVSREWLFLVDSHVGYQSVRSTYVAPVNPLDPSMLASNPVNWPGVLSLTAFARVQWRYR